MKRFIGVFAISLLFFSCNEFLLKKTVDVKELKLFLNVDIDNGKIVGAANYLIENEQNTPLKEMFVISHPSVFVDSIKIDESRAFFDLARIYGYNVYRMALRSLKTGERRSLTLSFHIDAPVSDGRFIFSREMIFFDAKKVWLPVPFMGSPGFKFYLKVKLPKDYVAITGAKIRYESIDESNRIQEFESEIEDVLKTGTLIIGKFERFEKNNIYYYTRTKKNVEEILDISTKINRFLSSRIGEVNFSQIHIVNSLFQYEENYLPIEAESFGNVIMISNASEVSFENLSDIYHYMDYSGSDTLEGFLRILAHEFSHAYINDKLSFEPSGYLFSESIVDYMGILTLNSIFSDFKKMQILKNRFKLINMEISGKTEDPLFNFIYRESFLDSLFYNDAESYLLFLKMLAKKYEFTKISKEDILQTLIEVPLELRANRINRYFPGRAAEYIEKREFYNSFLEWTTVHLTNSIRKGKFKVTKYKLVTINHNFPFELDAMLIQGGKNGLVTNSLFITTSVTNILLPYETDFVKLTSRFDLIEENLYDNSIYFGEKPLEKLIEEALNYYYTGQEINIPGRVKFIGSKEKLVLSERSIEEDRKASWKLKGKTGFVVDLLIKERDSDIYIFAYRLLNNKVFSYTIIKGKYDGENVVLNSVCDPIL